MKLLTKVSLLFTCLNVVVSGVNSQTTCKDHGNKDVDWFIIYKLPEDHHSPYQAVRDGHGYFYMDVNSQEWQMGKIPMNETKHALYYTMQEAYNKKLSGDQIVVFYNDETPSKKVTEVHGHTKGVINFDVKSGYWLVHSLPRFPDLESYTYPPSGRMYGQTFLCISLPYSELDVIGKQFLYSFPWTWFANLPEKFEAENPNLLKAVKSQYVQTAPWNHLAEIKSSAGQQFLSFSKFTSFDADIYDAWIAPYFESELFTETWQNGRGKTFSNCSVKYKVENIRKVQIKDVAFKETKDHSKWCITKDKPWICIGGINRMDEQKERAGGMVCAKLPKVWTAFNTSVVEVESCNSKRFNWPLHSNVNLLQL